MTAALWKMVSIFIISRLLFLPPLYSQNFILETNRLRHKTSVSYSQVLGFDKIVTIFGFRLARNWEICKSNFKNLSNA